MKHKIVRTCMAFTLVSAMLLTICLPGGVSQAAKKATLKQKKFTVMRGKQKKIVIKNKKKNRKYTFSSNKKKIATV